MPLTLACISSKVTAALLLCAEAVDAEKCKSSSSGKLNVMADKKERNLDFTLWLNLSPINLLLSIRAQTSLAWQQ